MWQEKIEIQEVGKNIHQSKVVSKNYSGREFIDKKISTPLMWQIVGSR